MRESLVAGLKRVTDVKVMSCGHTWECCETKTHDICIIQLSHPYITTGKTVAVMCGCESWTIKKAEHRRIDAFELRKTQFKDKTLESPLDCKEINQSILKEISPGCSLEGLMLRLKLQSIGHLM